MRCLGAAFVSVDSGTRNSSSAPSGCVTRLPLESLLFRGINKKAEASLSTPDRHQDSYTEPEPSRLRSVRVCKTLLVKLRPRPGRPGLRWPSALRDAGRGTRNSGRFQRPSTFDL